ncbi:TnsA-like heteromeric transposase endonuclease subunit [Catellatospora chokoriensis]|uniref:TnsA endonuclease N terminal n=1 Tax=Catellatospora chokoriensis TaxID=310353 RepID=A0A8J3KFB5_9ACTN|nr:TnsA-like heteromeric transposase endonuclease subunit [Catellatospora chokoriensis]GIF94014.1 hypothetical protein Cch02nite_74580 [Catellatospora chokoriensis]
MVVSARATAADSAPAEAVRVGAVGSFAPVVDVSAATISMRQPDGSLATVPLAQLSATHLAGSVPWRRFRSRRDQRHLPGSYWSATTGSHVVYESQLELARLLLADFDPDVCGIWAQPLRLTAKVAGRTRSHVPDFLLVSPTAQVTLVNVKPARRVADPKIADQLAWPAVLARTRGWAYEVWSGADPAVLDNVRFLAGYRRRSVVSPQQVRVAADAVHDGVQLAAVERRLAVGEPAYTARPGLLAALWDGLLVTDLTRPLSGKSVLRRGER